MRNRKRWNWRKPLTSRTSTGWQKMCTEILSGPHHGSDWTKAWPSKPRYIRWDQADLQVKGFAQKAASSLSISRIHCLVHSKMLSCPTCLVPWHSTPLVFLESIACNYSQVCYFRTINWWVQKPDPESLKSELLIVDPAEILHFVFVGRDFWLFMWNKKDSTPTSLENWCLDTWSYNRSQSRWSTPQARILNLKRETEEAEARECTFSPRINSTSSRLDLPRGRPRVSVSFIKTYWLLMH